MKRGFTLVEIMVVSVLFALLSFAAYLALNLSLHSSAKADVNSDAYRACVLAIANLELDLHGGRVISPATGGPPVATMTIQRAKLDPAGRALVDVAGNPQWGPDLQVVLLAGGRLQRQGSTAAERHILAELGNAGKVTFERLATDLLEVTVVCEIQSPKQVFRSARRQSRARILLEN